MNHAIFKRVNQALFFIILTFAVSFSVFANELTDIEGHDYEDTIALLTEAGVISGYPDGTYRPDQTVNRVEFLKIVVGSTFDDIDTEATNDTCGFSDTVSGQWYIPYLCRALEEGIVQGYPDGTFKPEQTVNFVEAAKIAALAHEQDLSEDGSVWYEDYVTYTSDRLLIPPDVDALDGLLTRGQVAELLGRYYLLDLGELSDYLAEHLFDYILFDADENTLDPEDSADIDVDDYLDGTAPSGGTTLDEETWLRYEDLFNNPLQESRDDWTLTAETGDNTGIFTNWNFSGSDGQKVNIETDDTGTSFSVENTEDYSLDLTGFLEAVFQDQSYAEVGEDTDFSGIFNIVDDDFSYDWSEDRSGTNANFEDSFSWTDSATDSFYERSIVDGVPAESLLLTTPEVSSDDEDQTVFTQEFQYDENTGGVENWLWQSSDESLLVNQVAKDEYYTEFLGFSPSDQVGFLLEYDQEAVTESFDFTSDDGQYVLNMDMTNDDYDETMTYDSDEMDVALTLADMKNLDGTVTLSDNSGEQIEMTFADNVLTELTAIVQDGTDEVAVYYTGASDYYEYGYITGLLTTEEGTYSLFTEEGMYDHGTTVSTDEISVEADAVTLATSLLNLSFDGSDKDLTMDWEHSSADEAEQGSLLYNGLLSEFTWGLDLGDKEAYDEAEQSGTTMKWYKGFDLSLDPYRLVKGQQAGGVKGNDIQVDWTVDFDTEDAEFNQDTSIKKEGFEKDFETTVSLFDYWMRQQMLLQGEIKGVNVNLTSDTTVENGKVNGTTNVHASTDTIDADLSATFGSGKDFELDGTFIFTPPSLPGWTGKVNLGIDGSDVTVKPSLSLPVFDNDKLGVDLEIGGRFRTGERSQGSAKLNIDSKDGNFHFDVEANVSEGGEYGAAVGLGLNW